MTGPRHRFGFAPGQPSPYIDDRYCCTQEGEDIWCGGYGADDNPPTCPNNYILVDCPEPFTDVCDCAGAINLPGCVDP